GAQSGHDLATVGVAGDNGRAVLAGQHLAQSSDVSGKLGDRKLGCGDSVAVGLQALDDGAPTGAVGPGTMHQHNIRERIHFFTSFRSFYEHCFPKMEAPIFTFSEQKHCSSFPEVPSLHLTTFLSHVLSNSRTRTVGARYCCLTNGICKLVGLFYGLPKARQ